jgi:hypothetical protein
VAPTATVAAEANAPGVILAMAFSQLTLPAAYAKTELMVLEEMLHAPHVAQTAAVAAEVPAQAANLTMDIAPST